MSSLQVLEPALDRRLVTPARLSEIVGLGGSHAKVDSIIGPVAEAADPVTALANQQRFIDMAGEKVENILQGRILYRQGYRSRQPGTSMQRLQLPQWPVESEGLEILSNFGVSLGVVTSASTDSSVSHRLEDPRDSPNKRYLYRDGGWPARTWVAAFQPGPIAGTEFSDYRIDFTAGRLMPGEIDDWTADRAYIPNSSSSVGIGTVPAFGSWARPSLSQTNELLFQCVTAGTTASAEPSWPKALPWFPETAYATDDYTIATKGPINLWFRATTGGTSNTIEPTWPLVDGDTVDDGSVVWTAREELEFAEVPGTLVWNGHFAVDLPLALQDAVALVAINLAKKVSGEQCKKGESTSMAMREFSSSIRRLAA